MLIEKWTPRRIGSAENEVSAKTDVQIKMWRNEMLIIKSKHIGTYTMAKLTEALRGERTACQSHANNYQQQNTQMLNDLTSIQTHTHQ